MKRTVRILTRARADVDRIFAWLERRSPRGAATWYDAFLACVGDVSNDPDRYAVVPESMLRWQRDIRQASFQTLRGRRYRVVFECTPTELCVLRVRGPGQLPLRSRDLPQA